MPRTLVENIYPQVVDSSRELEAFQPLPSDVVVPEYFQFPVFPVSVCVCRGVFFVVLSIVEVTVRG